MSPKKNLKFINQSSEANSSDSNLKNKDKLDVDLDENNILDDDLSSMSNLSNMISMSTIYMPNTPNTFSINNNDILEDISEDKI